ncbi:MAG: hypothetical protein ACR2FU_17895 [Streptosporangiaceae bacterium]
MTETPPTNPAPAGHEGYPGQGYPGQGYPGQGYPGQDYPGQGYPRPSYPGQGYPGYPAAGRVASGPAPGGVPLRPLGLGEILGGAFSLVRQNPKATLGLTATIVTTLAVSLALILLIAAQTSKAVGLVAIPAGLALYGLLLGGLTASMGRSLLGRKLAIREAAAASYAGRVMLALLVLGLGFAVPWWLLIATLKGWGALIALPLTAWMVVMVSLTIPVVVLEGRWPFPAVARSWRLVLGSYWRLIGIYLLTYLMTTVLSFVISIPIEVGGGLAGAVGSTAGSHAGAFLWVGVIAIGEIIVFSLTATIQTGVLVLAYADMRMRKEGMDLVLQQAAYEGRLSGDEFAATRPGSAYTGGVNPGGGWAAGPPAV